MADAVKSYQQALLLLGPRSAATLCANFDPETNADLDVGLARAHEAAGRRLDAIRHLETAESYYANAQKWRTTINAELARLRAGHSPGK